jgi:tetratricopeptide (TPR) repeat protein
MARRIGDPATLAYALDLYIPANESPENTRELLELSSELLEAAMKVGDKERAVEAHEHRHNRLLELGEMPEAKRELDAMAKLAEELRQPAQEWLVGVDRARLALLQGRLAEAEGLIEQTRILGERAQSWNAAVSFRLQLYVLRWEQGRLEEVQDMVKRSVEDYPTYAVWRCVEAHMATELGLATEAREIVEILAADDFAGVPFDAEWLVSMSLLAETAAFLHDAQRATVLYERLVPYADRVSISYPEIALGSVSRYVGLLATTMGRFGNAERRFEDALAMNHRIGARPWLAHSRSDYARILLARNRAGDRERAQELVDLALVTYRELGMETYPARVLALGEKLGATG